VGCEEPSKAKQVPRKLVLPYLDIIFRPKTWKVGEMLIIFSLSGEILPKPMLN
jgi:hypothetical protein